MRAQAVERTTEEVQTPLKGTTLAAVMADQLSRETHTGRREDLLVIFAALQVQRSPLQKSL
jgi:hypothetical protein